MEAATVEHFRERASEPSYSSQHAFLRQLSLRYNGSAYMSVYELARRLR